ncbi:RNA-binding (RRM/RBD/RNP motifs) family protein [Striga asiatica]|uniref:RNA-binding (RRM/RBD/RNP motifs) family protein n=1 Tax=Striga asiatica TaxID=4170 RepID=A0A5A7QL75_STRAF|nr:RNA-binding (RRM/RBD/RNP motifs) family protein [Striga asiatica]
METDQGKLFVGGISWDTNEERLREYFGTYGEVVEAVIMRDRTTGRARGFGFIVFADPVVAEKVVKEKHMIDGRTVEAKKAVPRDDHNLTNRNSSSSSIHGSPVPGRTKKIFVGGLASTVTESDFKNYFTQFGTITDVVVMYDHNTQRPRGFGFITYDSEDAVDRVLHKTFHELNGKMVEVKRAVPKELSPGPTRGPLLGYNYGFSRGSGFLGGLYPQGYNLSSLGRYNPLADARAGFSQFGSPAYGLGVNMDQGLNPGFGGRVMSPYFSSTQSRYNTPIGYNSTHNSSRGGESFLNSQSRNVWGNGGLGNNNAVSNSGSGSYFGSRSGGFGVFRNANWGTSNNSGGTVGGGTVGYRGGGENNYAFGSGGSGRNSGMGVGSVSAFSASGSGYEGSYGDFYRGGSVYGDPTWQTPSSEMGNSGSFGYGLRNSEDVAVKESEDFGVGNCNIGTCSILRIANRVFFGAKCTCSVRAVSRDFAEDFKVSWCNLRCLRRLLFGDYGFTAKSPRTWFRIVDQLPMNVGDEHYDSTVQYFYFAFCKSYGRFKSNLPLPPLHCHSIPKTSTSAHTPIPAVDRLISAASYFLFSTAFSTGNSSSRGTRLSPPHSSCSSHSFLLMADEAEKLCYELADAEKRVMAVVSGLNLGSEMRND